MIVHGEINANPPQHMASKYGLIKVVLNDLPIEEKQIIKGEKTDSTLTPKKLYADIKKKLISQFSVVRNQTETFLQINVSNIKQDGQTTPIQVFDKPISQTISVDGNNNIIDVLNNGSTKQILSANNRLSDFGKTLYKIFEQNPFSEDVDKNNIVNIERTLNKQLGRIINVSDYSYKLIPDNSIVTGKQIGRAHV